eukprot:10785215-Alexandrium_andersonii.AAC.1
MVRGGRDAALGGEGLGRRCCADRRPQGGQGPWPQHLEPPKQHTVESVSSAMRLLEAYDKQQTEHWD